MHTEANLTIAIRAARKAGEIIARALDRRDRLKIHEKSHNDFVTDIDIQADEAIIEIIRTAYPQDSFLTEEQGEIWGEDRDTIWVIDPLDGTLNFLHGFPHFAVSIAKKVKGRVEQAVIFNPVSQDLFTAIRGGGATLNDRRIRVSSRANLHGAMLATNLPRLDDHTNVHSILTEKMLPEIAALRRTGSTALDLAYVAAGFLDAFVCVHFYEWDIAAGLLLVREAGGLVTDLKGGDEILKRDTLLAAPPKLAKPLLAALV